ncbi:MAG: nicotinamide-nucleotide amidohydrolase family protein [Bacteroidales bacterium]|nr:nicotinamide-nucleotide amidohydrolase family protein [Bacteroidales bacterium]
MKHIIEYLIENKISITVMESCTSGMIASRITDTEGASAIFKGGFVTYSNEAKIAAGVDATIIEKYGVYSKECAEAMALTAQRNFASDIAIGITGSTGNVDPANKDSIIGEVFFCIVFNSEILNFHYSTNVIGKTRHKIKKEYTDKTFAELKKIICSK